MNNTEAIIILLFRKPFDIIDEEDEEIEEFEMPTHGLPVILSHDAITDPNFDKKVNRLCIETFRHDALIKNMFQVSSATDEFIKKFRECENLSRVERVIDLQSKGSQTDSSSSDYQNDWHETFLSDNDLKLAKIKVVELGSNSKKEEIIKKGLLEKVS